MSKFWLLEQDAEIFHQLGRRLMRDGSLGVKNTRKIYEAEQKFSNAQRVFSDDHILPPDFPVPMLSMPDDGFAPDYFSIEMFKFCSKRFRESLDQPDSVVQYMSINLLGGGTMVQGQDYQWMRVIAQQPAIDLQKSLCTVKELTNRFTGAPFKLASFIERYVLLDNLHPKTEIFRMQESPTHILATDGLALRVLRAGCAGMEFSDPGNERRPSDHRYRTATGIETYRYGY